MKNSSIICMKIMRIVVEFHQIMIIHYLQYYYYFYAQNRYTDEKDRELNKNWFKHEYYTTNSNNID